MAKQYFAIPVYILVDAEKQFDAVEAVLELFEDLVFTGYYPTILDMKVGSFSDVQTFGDMRGFRDAPEK